MKPIVSVIIAARNERQRLPVCIAALRRQTFAADKFEIIVVDDDSTDGTLAWARAQADLTTLSVAEADPYRARNAGAATSDAELLAFTDAHCTAREDWLEKLLDAFANKGVGVAIGGLSYRDDASPAVRLYAKHHQTKMKFIHSHKIDEARFCHAANFAIRKSLFDACEGFRALPLPGDTDLLQRILEHHPSSIVHYEHDADVKRQSTLSLRDLLNNTVRHARLNDGMTAADRFRPLSWPERRAVFAACRREYGLSALAAAGLAATLVVTTLAYNGSRWHRKLSK